MTHETTTKISAMIGDKLIRNAAKFFDASLTTIMNEAVQNARRAGASTITFALHGDDLEIADDGRGLAAEDARVLLSLGGSANDERVEANEDAAGIGFFSLGNHDVDVTSRDWTMSIPVEAFSGRAQATLSRRSERTDGMRILVRGFLRDETRTPWRIAGAARQATVFSGLTCVLLNMPRGALHRMGTDDHLTSRREKTIVDRQSFAPERFLDCYDAMAIATHVVELAGVTVKIVRHASRPAPSAINFFGQVLSSSPDSYDDPIGDLLGMPKGDTVATLADGGITTERFRFAALVDVTTTGRVALKLPDRSTLIENEGLQALRSSIRRGIQDLLRRPGIRNGLSMRDPLRADAPDLPPGDIRIIADANGNDESLNHHALQATLLATRDEAGRRIVVDLAGRPVEIGSIVTGVMSDGLHAILDTVTAGERPVVHDESDVEDALGPGRPRLIGESFVVRIDDEEFESGIEPFTHDDMGEDFLAEVADVCKTTQTGGRIARDIHVRLHVQDADGGTRIWKTVPVGTVFWAPECCCGAEDLTIVAAEGTQADVIENALLQGTDWYSPDGDNDSYDTQRARTCGAYAERVATILGNAEDLLLERMRKAVSDYAVQYLAAKGVDRSRIGISFERDPDGWVRTKIDGVGAESAVDAGARAAEDRG